jgi:hypothetical protein
VPSNGSFGGTSGIQAAGHLSHPRRLRIAVRTGIPEATASAPSAASPKTCMPVAAFTMTTNPLGLTLGRRR